MGEDSPQPTAESGLVGGTQSAEPCIRRGRRGRAPLSCPRRQNTLSSANVRSHRTLVIPPAVCVSPGGPRAFPPNPHTQPPIILRQLPAPWPCWRKQPFPAPPRLPPPMADPCVPSGVSWACPLGHCCRCSGQGSHLESALPPPPAQGRGRGWAGEGRAEESP